MYSRVSDHARTCREFLGDRARFLFSKASENGGAQRLKLRQLERLMILGLNLPDDLSEVDLEKIIELM